MRQPARAADARHEDGLFRRELLVTAEPLHRGEDRVVAAAGAPAGDATLVVLELAALVVQLQQAFGGGNRHEPNLARITSMMAEGRIGAPRT